MGSSPLAVAPCAALCPPWQRLRRACVLGFLYVRWREAEHEPCLCSASFKDHLLLL
jgi:hypothetical protein